MRVLVGHVFLLILLAGFGAFALNDSPQSFTLDGKLFTSDRVSPLIDSAAKVKIQILDPSKNCILYEEEQPVDTSASEGHFNMQVGSVVGSVKRKANDSGNTMQKVYQNSTPIAATGVSCGGLYTPALGAIRYVRVIVTPSAQAPSTLTPDMVLDAVPNAVVAQSLQGLEKENILQSNPAMSVTQSKLEQFFAALSLAPGSSVKFDGTNYVPYDPSNGANLAAGSVTNAAISSVAWAKITSLPTGISAIASLSCANGEILKMVSGSWACATESGVGSESDPTVAAYAKNAPGAGLTVSGSTIVADFGTGAGKVAQGNDARFSDSRAPNGAASGDLSGTYPSPTVAKIQGRGVSVTAPADGQILKYDNASSLWVPYNFGIGDLKTNAGTPQFISASCTASQTLIWSSVTNTFSCTTIGITGSQVSGDIAGNAANVTGTVAIANGGTGASNASAALTALLPSQSGQNGKVLQTNGTTASWQTPAASGITSFNGSNQASQTLVTPGVTGTQPNWSTNTGMGEHTLNIPMASTASVTAGLISKTDYDAFAAKLSSESDPKVGANTTNYLSKWNGSALVASGVIENSGNIGVGTATPSEKLDVAGRVRGTELCIGGDCRSSWPSLAASGTAVGFHVERSSAGAYYTFATNSDYNPDTKVFDSNAAWSLANNWYVAPEAGTYIFGWSFWSNSPTATVRVNLLVDRGSGFQAYTVTGDNAGSRGTSSAMVLSAGDKVKLQIYSGTISGYAGVGHNSFWGVKVGASGSGSLPGGSTTQIQYNDGGTLAGASSFYWDKTTGRVGIGSTSPTTKLDVNGTVNASAFTVNGSPLTTGGVTSLNGSSQATQTFAAPGTAGTAPAWSTNTGTGAHTLNIPMASTASVTAGLISKTDYDNFNSKMSASYGLAGDVTGTPAATVVDRIKGITVSAAPSSAGQILRYNGTQLQPAFLSMFDLRSTTTGAQAFGGVGCLSHQTLTWTAATDNLACTNISLPASQISGTISASSLGTGTANSTTFLRGDGTWATPSGSGGTSVAFSVNKNGAAQTVSTNTWTLVTWPTENYDTNNNFASNRFTPTAAGKYNVTFMLYCTDSTSTCQAAIYKNGALNAYQFTRTTTGAMALVTTLVDMNGSTDYLEAYAYNGGGTNLGGNSTYTYFTGGLISGGGGGGSGTPGGSSAQMQFNDAGVFAGATNFVWDKTNSRVGIGTATPAYKVDVVGDVNVTGNFKVNGVNIGSGSGTLTVGSVINTTSGTAVDLTGIPAGVNRITISFNGVSTNGTAGVKLLLGTSGGFETTGYNSLTNTFSGSPGAVGDTTCMRMTESMTAAYAIIGHVLLTRMSGNLWIMSANLGLGGSIGNAIGSGSKTLSGTLDRLRLTTTNGTDVFDAGSFNIMYE